MQLYSQRDPRWRNYKLGNSKLSIGNDGCAITSIGMLAGLDPIQTNALIKAHSGFVGAIVLWDVAARALGLKYDLGTGKKVFPYAIGETDHYKAQGYPQHFFVVLPDDTIADPLGGIIRPKDYYNIVSYRNISGKEFMSEDQFVALSLPQYAMHWEAHHGNKPDYSALEQDLRKVFRQQVNYTDLLSKQYDGQ